MKRILKFCYRILPFKKQLFSFFKNFWHQKEFIFKYLHFNAVIKARVVKTSFFKVHHVNNQIENELFWVELVNVKKIIYIWIELSNKLKMIYDIGSCSCIYSLTSNFVNKNIKIYIFSE